MLPLRVNIMMAAVLGERELLVRAVSYRARHLFAFVFMCIPRMLFETVQVLRTAAE